MTERADARTSGMTDMLVDAFLADAATTADGKIYAMGMGWNVLSVGAFPAVHPRLALALTIHVPYSATNAVHHVSVHLESEDGDRIGLGQGAAPGGEPVPLDEIRGEFSVGRPPLLPAGDAQLVPLTLTVDGLTLERPALYSWVIAIDDVEMRRLPMRVAAVSPRG